MSALPKMEIIVTSNTDGVKTGLAYVRQELTTTAQAAAKASPAIIQVGTAAQAASQKTTIMANAAGQLKNGLLGAINPMGLMITGALSLGAAFIGLATQQGENNRKMLEAAKAAAIAKQSLEEYNKSVSAAFADAAKENSQVLSLIAVLKSETETRERKLSAIKELNKIAPESFGNLKLEGSLVMGIDAAYQSYIKNVQTVVALKIKQGQLEKVTTQILEAEGATLTKSQKDAVDGFKKIDDARNKSSQRYDAPQIETYQTKKRLAAENEITVAKKNQLQLIKDIQELSTGVKLKQLKVDELKIKPDKIKIDVTKAKAEVEGEIGVKLPDRRDFQIGVGINSQRDNNDPYGVLGKRGTPATTDSISVMLENRRKKLLEIANITTSIVGPAIDSVFANIGKGSRSVIQGLGNVIKQLTIAVFKAVALQAISGLITGGGKLGAGFLSGVFKNLFSGGGFATGVRNFSGGLAMVGERGPELVNLPKGADVIPNHAIGGALSGGSMNLTGDFRILGTDLVLALTRTQQYLTRTN